MKKHFILYCLLPVTIFAQDRIEGLYNSANDYYAKSINYRVGCRSKDKIHRNDFFMRPYVTVKQEGKKVRLNKKEVFGYRTCDGEVYRFLNKRQLELLNPGDSILIYRHNRAKGPKGLTNVTNYYFSRGANPAPQPLTFKNLHKAFSDNSGFVEALDELYKYNTQLASYDTYFKRYKMSLIYDRTAKR